MSETPTDARGHRIQPGDTVLYFKTGKFPEKVSGIVENVDAMITLGSLDQISPKKKVRARDTTRVNAGSLIVVDALPQVQGRLNTAAVPQFPSPAEGEMPDTEPLSLEEYARRRGEYLHAMGLPSRESTTDDLDSARTLPDALRHTITDAVRSYTSQLALYREMTQRLPWADYLAGYTDTAPEQEDGNA